MKPRRRKACVERDETIEIVPSAISAAALDALAVEFGKLAARIYLHCEISAEAPIQAADKPEQPHSR